MDLGLIRRRVRNRYYRQLPALIDDLNRIRVCNMGMQFGYECIMPMQ
jgi:hypothetical protein